MKYLPIYAALLLSAALTLTACDETVFDPNDIDGDGVPNTIDVDDDNDGLIEISSLAQLYDVRNNTRGTSFVVGNRNTGDTRGASTKEPANCSDGNRRTIVPLCGYELTATLDFDIDDDGSTRAESGNGLDADDDGDYLVTIDNQGHDGWEPIGDNAERFNAIFEGNGYTIANLPIHTVSAPVPAVDGVANTLEYFGLFGAVGSDGYIRNLHLVDPYVVDDRDSDSRYYVGSLAGRLFGGIVSGCSATSTGSPGMLVRAGSGNGDNIGGLIGRMDGGMVVASYVSGLSDADDSQAIVEDPGGNRTRIGGLIGGQYGGRIIASYVTNTRIANAAAESFSSDMSMIGGLVGEQNGGENTIIAATYTDVTFTFGNSVSNSNIGGLLGGQSGGGTIAVSYTMGDINVESGDENNVGGLIGRRDGPLSHVIGNYTTGDITGRDTGNNDTTDRVGTIVGYQPDDTRVSPALSIPSPDATYGFGTAMGGTDRTTVSPAPPATASTPAGLTLANAGTCTLTTSGSTGGSTLSGSTLDACEGRDGRGGSGSWNHWNELHIDGRPIGHNAWIFTTGSWPLLRYADYDGDNSGIGYCSFFPDTVPGTSTRIVCGSTPLGGPGLPR